MPMHDWSSSGDWLFHDFHLGWVVELQKLLNGGLLPTDFYAMAECHTAESLVVSPSPKGKRRTIAIRHVEGHGVVALIEIVTPANKGQPHHLTAFLNKMVVVFDLGIHILLVDPFPPGPADPLGMHGAVWRRVASEKVEVTEDRPLAFASYRADRPVEAFVNHLAVGDELPDVPLFLSRKKYIDVPLESTYTAAYAGMAAFWRKVLEKKPA